jgi:hypothetical protein
LTRRELEEQILYELANESCIVVRDFFSSSKWIDFLDSRADNHWHSVNINGGSVSVFPREINVFRSIVVACVSGIITLDLLSALLPSLVSVLMQLNSAGVRLNEDETLAYLFIYNTDTGSVEAKVLSEHLLSIGIPHDNNSNSHQFTSILARLQQNGIISYCDNVVTLTPAFCSRKHLKAR